MQDETPNDLISTTKAAKLLGLTSETVRQWVASGKIHGYRVGRLIKVSQAEVLGSVKPIN
jgi:excisionase family DNA binding protein